MNAMDGRNGEGCHLIIVLVFKYAFSKVTTAQISWQYHIHCQKHILKLYVKQSIQNYPNHLKNLTVHPHHHMACQMNAEWEDAVEHPSSASSSMEAISASIVSDSALTMRVRLWISM
jgi:hypothetical protein